jgi:hypothetical protein
LVQKRRSSFKTHAHGSHFAGSAVALFVFRATDSFLVMLEVARKLTLEWRTLVQQRSPVVYESGSLGSTKGGSFLTVSLKASSPYVLCSHMRASDRTLASTGSNRNQVPQADFRTITQSGIDHG